MPAAKKRAYNRVVMYDSSSRDSESTGNYPDRATSEEEDVTDDITLEAMIGQEVERIRSQTPMLTPPIGCITEIPSAADAIQPDAIETPIRGQSTSNTGPIDNDHADKTWLKQNIRDDNTSLDIIQEPRRSERIRSAKRVVKLGGVEYF